MNSYDAFQEEFGNPEILSYIKRMDWDELEVNEKYYYELAYEYWCKLRRRLKVGDYQIGKLNHIRRGVNGAEWVIKHLCKISNERKWNRLNPELPF